MTRSGPRSQTGRPGYVPAGLKHAEEAGWRAPLPDYALPGQEAARLPKLSLSSLLSGAVGVLGLLLLTFAARRAWARKDEDGAAGLDAHSDPT